MANRKIIRRPLVVSLAVALAFVVGGISQGCRGDRRTLRELVLVEGSGLKDVCRIGGAVSDAEAILGRSVTKGTVGDRFSGVERERWFPAYNVLIDTIQIGGNEEIVRISLVLSAAPETAPVREGSMSSQGEDLRARTKSGLVLLPVTSSRQLVTDMYGPPEQSYDSLTNRAVVENIRSGVPYSVVLQGGVSEYIHYPSFGVSFVLEGGQVSKCSVEEPHTRQVWRL